jgi:hypothetical protein
MKMTKLLQRYLNVLNHKSKINLYDFCPIHGENTYV